MTRPSLRHVKPTKKSRRISNAVKPQRQIVSQAPTRFMSKRVT